MRRPPRSTLFPHTTLFRSHTHTHTHTQQLEQQRAEKCMHGCPFLSLIPLHSLGELQLLCRTGVNNCWQNAYATRSFNSLMHRLLRLQSLIFCERVTLLLLMAISSPIFWLHYSMIIEQEEADHLKNDSLFSFNAASDLRARKPNGLFEVPPPDLWQNWPLDFSHGAATGQGRHKTGRGQSIDKVVTAHIKQEETSFHQHHLWRNSTQEGRCRCTSVLHSSKHPAWQIRYTGGKLHWCYGWPNTVKGSSSAR